MQITNHKSQITNPFIVLCTLYFVLLFSSCKINYGFSGATTDAKTATVIYFQNQASLAKPTVSQTFTEAMKDILQSQGKVDLVDKGGEIQFEGQVTGYAVAPVALQSNDQSSANRLTITVFVKFTNTKEGSKNFETSFSRYADFPSSQNLSSVEDQLIKDITDQLVQDIFNRALSDW